MEMLRLYFENLGEVVVGLLEGVKVAKAVLAAAPFSSSVTRWKEEVYFETPVEAEGEGVTTVRPGDAAYWPPGKGFCLFYGVSQPYSPVVVFGRLIGPAYYLRWVEEGSKVEVARYRDYGKTGKVAKKLREAGVVAASRVWEDEESVVVLLESGGASVGAEVFVEDYGYMVEGDALFFYDQSPTSVSAVEKLRAAAGDFRVDLNEDGYAILSFYAADFDSLVRGLRALPEAYAKARRALSTP